MGSGSVLGAFASLGRFVWAIFYLFIIVPISIVVFIGEAFVKILQSSWILAALLGLALLGLGVSSYSNVVIETVDYAVRCIIRPIVESTVLLILDFVRSAYNPVICFWDAAQWFMFGYFNNVVAPGVLACGVHAFLVDVGCVVTQFFESFVLFIATGEFLVGFYDMSNLSAAIVQAVDDWILMGCCLCQDVCCLTKNIPFILFFLPPPFSIIIPALAPHYLFWQSLESIINFASSILQILWPLLINLLALSPPLSRPSFDKVSFYACQFWGRFTKASELAIQRVWDTFVPFRINFTGTLAWSATLNCVIIDSLEVILTVASNADIIVFNMFTAWPNSYVGPPYTQPVDIWHTTVRDIIVRIMNTHAPITDPDFYFDVHTIGRQPMTECLCTLISAVICDPAGLGNGSCFNADPNNPTNTGGFLDGFNFCCATTAVITGVNDGLKGVYGMFLHTTSATDWFLWLDTQPDTYIQVQDIVNLARCVFSIVDAVPVVGYCLKQVRPGVSPLLFK